jgi:hypothetical protein
VVDLEGDAVDSFYIAEILFEIRYFNH